MTSIADDASPERRPDLARAIAEHVVRVAYEDLSPTDVEATKKLVLDTLATSVAGSGETPFPALLDHLVREGGRGESTVLVHGARLPARHAVTLNSGMARAIDLDDVHEEAIVHTGVHVVPAALALAEREGGISGRALLVAIAAAQDVMIRLSLACETRPILRGRPGTYVFGTFATALVAAKLLRLGVDATVDALGNAYTRSAGTTLGYHQGALAQRTMKGLAASDGVLAALLAQRGIGGITDCFEGDAGYFPVHEQGRYDRSRVLDGLGSRFLGTQTALKRYPVHRGAALDIEVALAVRRDPAFDLAQVERVEVRYPARFEAGHARIGAFAPGREDPKGPIEPHFSNPWAIGVALARTVVGVDDFTEAGVARLRREVVPIAAKVRGIADPALDADVRGLGPRVLEVTLKNGRRITARVEGAPGGPDEPFSWPQLTAKLDDCARRSVRPLAPESLEELVRTAQSLEQVEDCARIPAMLVGQ
ncbi:MAG: MmgE/PrpD family protein [Myxococcota bacterium]